MFYLCTQVADAAKMPKNNTAPLLARFASWLAAAAKGRELGFGPASERASGVVTKTSTNNNSNKGGSTNTNKGLKKRKRKKREHPLRALLYQFSYIFL